MSKINFDLDQFFAHESQSSPPSLSVGGKLPIGKKADLLSCLQLEEMQTASTPDIDAIFLDGATVVRMLNPGRAKTFQGYADLVLIPYVKQKQGQGMRWRVVPTTMIIRIWKGFLSVDKNKAEMFSFLP